MYADLNLPFTISPSTSTQSAPDGGKKKQKAKAQLAANKNSSDDKLAPVLSSTEKQSINIRIDLLVRLGYTIIGLNQIIQSKFDPSNHHNFLVEIEDRKDLLLLRRLTIVLDEASEKGNGLTNNNISTLSGYDIISIQPTTAATFSLACLSYSVPSPLTSHIITLDLASLPKLPFYLKLSLVKTAIKNGAVFEICYSPAVSVSTDASRRRNWWANAREVARVTGGKGVLLSSGGAGPEVRGPQDVINIATLLGISQDKAKDAITKTVKTVIVRAQTRKTYRAVLSEPTLVLPNIVDLTTGHDETTTPKPTTHEQSEQPCRDSLASMDTTSQTQAHTAPIQKRPRDEQGSNRDKGKKLKV